MHCVRGYFLTEINSWFLESDTGRDYIRNTPAQRMGEMHEIEAPFMLLASGAGSFINGVALPVGRRTHAWWALARIFDRPSAAAADPLAVAANVGDVSGPAASGAYGRLRAIRAIARKRNS